MLVMTVQTLLVKVPAFPKMRTLPVQARDQARRLPKSTTRFSMSNQSKIRPRMLAMIETAFLVVL